MSATKNLPVLRIIGLEVLPDNDQWTNRFEIHSESSDRVYVISQNKKKRHWGCSCPSYRIRRCCKHLNTLNLPTNEIPYEVKIIHQ